MVQWNLRSNRKRTGGLVKRNSKKKKYQRGRDSVPCHIGEARIKKIRVRGGNVKKIVFSSDVANVLAGGKSQKAKIKGIVENAANKQFIRHGIITKGAIIETELGKARVTSRPGQDGAINAVLVEAVPAGHDEKLVHKKS